MHRSVRASRLNTANCRSIYRSVVSLSLEAIASLTRIFYLLPPRESHLRRIDVCCIREIFSRGRIASKLDTRVLFHYTPLRRGATPVHTRSRIALTLTDCRAARSPPPALSLSLFLSFSREEFKCRHLHTRKRKHPT